MVLSTYNPTKTKKQLERDSCKGKVARIGRFSEVRVNKEGYSQSAKLGIHLRPLQYEFAKRNLKGAGYNDIVFVRSNGGSGLPSSAPTTGRSKPHLVGKTQI